MFVNDLFENKKINEGGIDIPEIPRAPMPRPPKEKGVEEGSAQDRLHRRHQELRKKSGLPDPDYYKELRASYDIENDQERQARQAEIKKKYRVAEGMDDTVKFEVDSENAYNHIMDKFGSVVEWDGDIMVAPRRYWGAIQELAYAAGGEASEEQGVAEGLPQTLRKVVPGYAKREIDKKMDAGKFGKTDTDKDANYYRYKKIQDKLKEQGVAEGVEQYLEEMRRAGYDIVTEAATSCPECGGTAYADQMLAEKQDACYSKVKSRYKVWPSAYASGALVRCRKVGAKNWGNKSKK